MKAITLALCLCACLSAQAQIKVTVYTYQADPRQTDDTPLITADGSKIDTLLLNKGYLFWVAVSPDLEEKFPVGYSEMYIEGIGDYTGVYQVKDRMNARHRRAVDILICLSSRPQMWRDVSIYEIDSL